jgi:hypothetical protein
MGSERAGDRPGSFPADGVASRRAPRPRRRARGRTPPRRSAHGGPGAAHPGGGPNAIFAPRRSRRGAGVGRTSRLLARQPARCLPALPRSAAGEPLGATAGAQHACAHAPLTRPSAHTPFAGVRRRARRCAPSCAPAQVRGARASTRHAGRCISVRQPPRGSGAAARRAPGAAGSARLRGDRYVRERRLVHDTKAPQTPPCAHLWRRRAHAPQRHSALVERRARGRARGGGVVADDKPPVRLLNKMPHRRDAVVLPASVT